MIDIYRAHPGPYSLMITRRVDGKKVPSEVKGPFLAHAAHAAAITLITDPIGTAVEVYVFSEKEKQFIGAMYFRGRDYTSWSEEEIHALASAPESPRVTPRKTFRRQPADQPVREEDADLESRDGGSGGDDGVEVPDVPRRSRASGPRDRFPAVRGKGLALGTPEGWPPSKPAQAVKEFFAAGRTATVAEVVQAIGPALAEMGMQFPAALVSRLKQKGLLKEISE